MNIRRLISFVVMLPTWPLAILAAVADDEAEVSNVVSCFKDTWRRTYEK